MNIGHHPIHGVFTYKQLKELTKEETERLGGVLVVPGTLTEDNWLSSVNEWQKQQKNYMNKLDKQNVDPFEDQQPEEETKTKLRRT